jgi:glycosyltransferase involved in cell wall biosynthesis
VTSLQVLVPCIGDLELLELQLRSLIAQRDPEWTAAVVAGSAAADDALALVDRLGDPRLGHVPWDGTTGIGATWNRALDLATGDLVVLAHADDELLPGYVGSVRAAAEHAPRATLIVPRAVTIDRVGRLAPGAPERVKARLAPRADHLTLERGQRALTRLMVGQWIVCPAVAYRRSLLGAQRFSTELDQALDLDLFGRLILAGATVASTSDVVYRYRRHAASQTAFTTASGRRFREEAIVHRRISAAAVQQRWWVAAAVAAGRPTGRVHQAWIGLQQLRQRRRTRAHSPRSGAV